ncbi:hypothetical protein BE11_22440 [Sorangium cellulosum]|nr:hypothetical protein BE11_22440 [Sorangium cellulosum]
MVWPLHASSAVRRCALYLEAGVLVLDKRMLWVLVLGFSSLASGCSITTAAGDGGGTGGTGGTGGAGGGGSDTEGGAVVQQHINLYDCNLPLACQQMFYHSGDVSPAQATNCAAKHIVSGSPAVLSALDSPGGGCRETEMLIVVQGDGKALVQSRHRTSDEFSCEPGDPWEASSAHQICDIVLADRTEAACQADEWGDCHWTPFGWASTGQLANCQEVEDRTCAEVSGLLD